MSLSISVVVYGVNEAENFAKFIWEVREYLEKVASQYQFIFLVLFPG